MNRREHEEIEIMIVPGEDHGYFFVSFEKILNGFNSVHINMHSKITWLFEVNKSNFFLWVTIPFLRLP